MEGEWALTLARLAEELREAIQANPRGFPVIRDQERFVERFLDFWDQVSADRRRFEKIRKLAQTCLEKSKSNQLSISCREQQAEVIYQREYGALFLLAAVGGYSESEAEWERGIWLALSEDDALPGETRQLFASKALEADPVRPTVQASVLAACRRNSFFTCQFESILDVLAWLEAVEEIPTNGTQAIAKSPSPDFLLITVNNHETEAVLTAFRDATGTPATPVSIQGRVYQNLGKLNGVTVYHTLSEMGSISVGAMQQTADLAIRALDPKAIISIGVAFGVNDQKQNLGEILISKQLCPYDLQRIGADEIVLRDVRPPASDRLINYFDTFQRSAWDGPRVHMGVVLSGSKLVDNIDYRDDLLANAANAIGGEMEGAGLYVACQQHKVDWIVLKAICDWADGNKSVEKEVRQREAATTAARFLVEAIRYVAISSPD